MKNLVCFICMMLTMGFAVYGFASTKYDDIIVNPEWKQIINGVDPGGHPKSPTCGHLKIPHPTAVFRT